MISVFDIFKIGVGPSSSHTVGPMKAAKQFVDDLRASGKIRDITRIQVDVYGSLSWTGKGHHTDTAIIMGLAGNLPENVDIDGIPEFISRVEQTGRLPIGLHCHRLVRNGRNAKCRPLVAGNARLSDLAAVGNCGKIAQQFHFGHAFKERQHQLPIIGARFWCNCKARTKVGHIRNNREQWGARLARSISKFNQQFLGLVFYKRLYRRRQRRPHSRLKFFRYGEKLRVEAHTSHFHK